MVVGGGKVAAARDSCAFVWCTGYVLWGPRATVSGQGACKDDVCKGDW